MLARLRRRPARPTPGATGTEPGSRSGAAPAPEDHAFSDMLRRAARERDVPLAMFADPGPVAPADQELAHALVTIERAVGHTCTLNGRCQEVCPVGIPLPALLRGWRGRSWKDGLVP